MVYPVVVIFVAVAIVTFIMIFIIPKFKKIFNDFGMTLPWADRRRSSRRLDVVRQLLVRASRCSRSASGSSSS